MPVIVFGRLFLLFFLFRLARSEINEDSFWPSDVGRGEASLFLNYYEDRKKTSAPLISVLFLMFYFRYLTIFLLCSSRSTAKTVFWVFGSDQ